MRVELLNTGDELVTGQIVDTNGPWLMDRLFTVGQTVARSVSVGDDLDELVGALREAAARAELVVVSGGLGPTLDDLTLEAACAAFGRKPLEEPAQLERLRARFVAAGRELTPGSTRQACVPEGAEALGNPLGTATAFVVRAGPCELWFVPGVPREQQGILEQQLIPRLAARLAAAGTFHEYRAVKCYGIFEAQLDQVIRPLLARHPHVRYGTRTTLPENHAKLLGTGASPAEAAARVEALEREVREALGEVVFGGAGDSFAGVTVAALRARGWKACFAESLTAGLAAATLAEAPGASDVLLGASVVYAGALKERWLDVPPALLQGDGAVSELVARAMAEGALRRSGADLAVSLTGWADAGAPGAQPGLVHAAITGGGLPTRAVRARFLHGRQEVRRAAAWLGLDLLRRRALGLER